MNNLTPEQVEKSRKEFEGHFKTFGVRFDRDNDGDYEAEFANYLWVGFQAGRSTARVKLPFEFNASCVYGVMDAALVRASLNSAGVSYEI